MAEETKTKTVMSETIKGELIFKEVSPGQVKFDFDMSGLSMEKLAPITMAWDYFQEEE